MRIAIVISHWNFRSDENLINLLSKIYQESKIFEINCTVVVNVTDQKPLSLYAIAHPVSILYRNNIGMNIGAWDHGWRSSFDCDAFIFLQDECLIVRQGWLDAYRRKLADASIGLIGESINHDMTWERFLRHPKPHRAAARQQLHDEIRTLGIDPGHSSRHLQSLVWAARRDVLERIGGFPIGVNKMQCIASEVGVSLKVQSAGLTVQLAGERHFQWISHPQWDPNASQLGAVEPAR